jgi:hypothetical protein
MDTVKLPGFTAEASLPTTAERYRMVGTRDPNASQGTVVPAAFCYWDCEAGVCLRRCQRDNPM